MSLNRLTGTDYINMISGGASCILAHVQEINDLNVFPIPDGDTGDNMRMTMEGGARVSHKNTDEIGAVAKKIASGMLLGARGNSGVILSQFFAGIAEGLNEFVVADVSILEQAFKAGVKRAYSSVMTPTEGTILTVAKDATNYACSAQCDTIEEFFIAFLTEAKRSLEHTPELLACLKSAGVVDSGGAGLIYIVEGMYMSLTGELPLVTIINGNEPKAQAIDIDKFTEDSEFKFGYCTELLIRLHHSKVADIENFDVNIISNYLTEIGNSVVCFKDGSIVKLHVHTFEPYKVLEYCQRFGEFLTIKIENMMIQHNEAEEERQEAKKPREKYAVITVAQGEGIKNEFKALKADIVIDGGQTMNPSSEDFIKAFDEVNAEHIFVLPNNGNIIMAARQSAKLYEKSDIRVIPTKTIGDAYAILTMLNLDFDDANQIEEEMLEAMQGVTTFEVSRSIRDSKMNDIDIKKDDYIGILGKNIVSANTDVIAATIDAVKSIDLSLASVVIVIRGKDGCRRDSAIICEEISKINKYVEVYEIEGQQDVYDYILVVE